MAFAKGQSKVLELVIALFVLLIVAWLLITWVSKAFPKGEEQIGGQIDKLKEEQLLRDAEKRCTALCEKIKDSRGGEGEIVTFCSTVGDENGLSIDGKGSKGYAEIAGEGVCKERIPCFKLIKCSYPEGAAAIDAKTCKASVCGFYAGKGLEPSRLGEELNNRLVPGACYNSSLSLHWFALAFGGADAGTLSCS